MLFLRLFKSFALFPFGLFLLLEFLPFFEAVSFLLFALCFSLLQLEQLELLFNFELF